MKVKQPRNINRRYILPGIFIFIFAALGTYLIFASHAATPSASVEPEQGSLSNGASVITDSTASGGSYVQFSH